LKNKLIQKKEINEQEIDSILNEVRNISRNLYPSVLQNLGLEISIENLCEKLTEELGLFTTCEINYTHKLSDSKELQLYRIIQEALNNTIKHGVVNAAKVILNSKDNFLYLEIKDNGKGFNYEDKIKNKNSFGLQSILQRAKAIAAKIDITSNNLGTKILLKIPL
jgi:signal transduction histidine kinase